MPSLLRPTPERIEEIADQCSSWFTPAGSQVRERILDHRVFAQALLSELEFPHDESWIPVSQSLPVMAPGECGWPESHRVLVYTSYGSQQVAYLMQMDEDCPIQWKSACSEGWDLTNVVTHWKPLPPSPAA